MVHLRHEIQDRSPSRSESDHRPPRSSRPALGGNRLYVDPDGPTARSRMPSADRDQDVVSSRPSGSHQSSRSSHPSRDQTYQGGSSRGQTGSYAGQPPPGRPRSSQPRDGPVPDLYQQPRRPTQMGNDVLGAFGGTAGVVYPESEDPRGHAPPMPSTGNDGYYQAYGLDPRNTYAGQYPVQPPPAGHSVQTDGYYGASSYSHRQSGQSSANGRPPVVYPDDDHWSVDGQDGTLEPSNWRRNRPEPVQTEQTADRPRRPRPHPRASGRERAHHALNNFDNQYSGGGSGASWGGR